MIYLERHDDDANLHRFYAMEVGRDLFGVWILERRWGRVGRGRGQRICAAFDSEAEALAAQQALIRAKIGRAYR